MAPVAVLRIHEEPDVMFLTESEGLFDRRPQLKWSRPFDPTAEAIRVETRSSR